MIQVELLLQEQCHQSDDQSEWICPEETETVSYQTNEFGMVNGELSTDNYNYINIQVGLRDWAWYRY